MSKRGNTNSQLSKYEMDALEDEEEDSGVFTKASADELKQRKIVKVKRPSAVESDVPKPSPFGGFSFGGPQPAETAPSKPNPFAGIGLVPTAPAPMPAAFPSFSFKPAASTTSTASTGDSMQSVGSIGSSSSLPSFGSLKSSSSEGSSTRAAASSTIGRLPSSKSSTSSSSNGESEYAKKVKKLNATFLAWADRQVKTNVMSIWKDGVRDYLTYQKGLKDKYPEEASTATANGSSSNGTKIAAPSSSAPVTAPAPAVTAPSAPSAAPSAPAPFTFGLAQLPAPKPAASAFTLPSIPAFPSMPGLPSTSSSIPAPAPFAFGSKSADLTVKPFSFNLPAPGAAAGVPPALPSTAFSFGGTSAPFAFTPLAAAPLAGGAPAAEEEDGGDDEGEPILPPEKVLRNADDTDEILLEVPCKLHSYSKEDQEWKDIGKGTFRLTSDPSHKKRMLVRNTMGRITFNAAFYKNMKIDKVKGGLRFNAFVSVVTDVKAGTAVTELKSFMIKMKERDVDGVKAKLEEIIAAQ